MTEASFILTLISAPLPGIIAAISTAIADLGGNITETNQHWDRPADRFFLRVAFVGPDLPIVLGAVWSGGASQPEDARPVDERYLVQSPAGLKVLLDDRQPSVTIETPAGNRLVITDQGGGKVTIDKALIGFLLITHSSTFTGGTTALDTATTVYVSPIGAFDPTILYS